MRRGSSRQGELTLASSYMRVILSIEQTQQVVSTGLYYTLVHYDSLLLTSADLLSHSSMSLVMVNIYGTTLKGELRFDSNFVVPTKTERFACFGVHRRQIL